MLSTPLSLEKNGRLSGMSTVIGIDETLSLRSSVLVRGNGSGLGGFTVGIQLEIALGAGGCFDEDEDDEGCDELDAIDDDAAGSCSARGSGGQRFMISAIASAFDGWRRSTSRKSV